MARARRMFSRGERRRARETESASEWTGTLPFGRRVLKTSGLAAIQSVVPRRTRGGSEPPSRSERALYISTGFFRGLRDPTTSLYPQSRAGSPPSFGPSAGRAEAALRRSTSPHTDREPLVRIERARAEHSDAPSRFPKTSLSTRCFLPFCFFIFFLLNQ